MATPARMSVPDTARRGVQRPSRSQMSRAVASSGCRKMIHRGDGGEAQGQQAHGPEGEQHAGGHEGVQAGQDRSRQDQEEGKGRRVDQRQEVADGHGIPDGLVDSQEGQHPGQRQRDAEQLARRGPLLPEEHGQNQRENRDGAVDQRRVGRCRSREPLHEAELVDDHAEDGEPCQAGQVGSPGQGPAAGEGHRQGKEKERRGRNADKSPGPGRNLQEHDLGGVIVNPEEDLDQDQGGGDPWRRRRAVQSRYPRDSKISRVSVSSVGSATLFRRAGRRRNRRKLSISSRDSSGRSPAMFFVSSGSATRS